MQAYNRRPQQQSYLEYLRHERNSDAKRNNSVIDIYGTSTLQPDRDGSEIASRLENEAGIFLVLVMEVERKILGKIEKMESKIIKEMK